MKASVPRSHLDTFMWHCHLPCEELMVIFQIASSFQQHAWRILESLVFSSPEGYLASAAVQMVLQKNNQPFLGVILPSRLDALALHQALIAHSLLNFFNDIVLGNVIPKCQQSVNNVLTNTLL